MRIPDQYSSGIARGCGLKHKEYYPGQSLFIINFGSQLKNKMSVRIECPGCPNKKCFVQSHCTSEWVQIINRSKEQSVYQKGQQLFREGDRVSGVFFIQHGKVKVVTNGLNGKEQIVRLASDAYIIGHCASEGERYPIGAIALEESTVCFLSNELLKSAYLENPEFTLAFMYYYSAELRKMESRLKYVAQMSIREKVVEALLYIYDIFGADETDHTLNVTMSRQELADLVGTNAEQVTRQLSLFQNENIISKQGKDLQMLRVDLLRKMVDSYKQTD